MDAFKRRHAFLACSSRSRRPHGVFRFTVICKSLAVMTLYFLSFVPDLRVKLLISILESLYSTDSINLVTKQINCDTESAISAAISDIRSATDGLKNERIHGKIGTSLKTAAIAESRT